MLQLLLFPAQRPPHFGEELLRVEGAFQVRRDDGICAIIEIVAIMVVDTNVFVSALLGPSGASREILRRCLSGAHTPLMSSALFSEYEAVLSRRALFRGCVLPAHEREVLLDAFLKVCRWIHVYYLWRPNLPDEADNYVIELAIAGAADAVTTRNSRDFAAAELRFPNLRIVSPEDFIKE